MPTLRLDGFDGAVPRTSATALGDRQAQRADNVRLYNGELRSWRGPLLAHTPPVADSVSIYKLINSLGEVRWLTWDTDVDVAPGPSADLVDARIYYTGAGSPRKTNWSLSGTGAGPYPGDYQEMGVPAPTAAPSVATTTGANPTAEDRVYVCTYVNTFGALKEESAPSPASALIAVGTSQAVVVSGLPAAPAGKYNVTAVRIYRSIAGSSGTSYAFVAEVSVGTTSHTDDLLSAGLGEALGTLGWLPPPSNMRGIVAMAGGVLAGFAGNTIYFSEPYYPHAWPVRYALNVPASIVGLGVVGTSLIVMTDVCPYIVSGVVPGAMSVEKSPLPEPCVSKQSIAVDAAGVVYASPNGLVSVGPGTQGIATQALFRRQEWQSYSPETLVGAIFDGLYFGFFRSPAHGQRCMVLSRDDVPALCFFDAAAIAAHVDARNAKLYYVGLSDGAIYEADADISSPLQYQWRSKRFVFPRAISFSLIRVDAQFVVTTGSSQPEFTFDDGDISFDNDELDWSQGYANALAQLDQSATENNQPYFSVSGPSTLGAIGAVELNGMGLNESLLRKPAPVASLQDVTVQIYGDGALVAQASAISLEPLRLAPFKARELEVVLFGSVPVRSILLATSGVELRG